MAISLISPVESSVQTDHLTSFQVAQQKAKADAGKIDFQGFLKILTTKLTHQDPLSGNGEPMDVMKDMAQMMSVQHASEQVTTSKSILEELKSLKADQARLSMGGNTTDIAILKKLESIDAKLSSLSGGESNTPSATASTLETNLKRVTPALNALDRFMGL